VWSCCVSIIVRSPCCLNLAHLHLRYVDWLSLKSSVSLCRGCRATEWFCSICYVLSFLSFGGRLSKLIWPTNNIVFMSLQNNRKSGDLYANHMPLILEKKTIIVICHILQRGPFYKISDVFRSSCNVAENTDVTSRRVSNLSCANRCNCNVCAATPHITPKFPILSDFSKHFLAYCTVACCGCRRM